MTRRRSVIATLCVALPALGALATGAMQAGTGLGPAADYKYDWLQFQFNSAKTANDTLETTITPSNVSQLTQLFNSPLTDAPDGAPVALSNVSTPGGVRDLVFTQGEHGTLTAWDGNTGATVWVDHFGTGGTNNSSPAIDPNRQFIYMTGNDGSVHKVNVATGAEVTGGGWPEADGGGKGSGATSIVTANDGSTYLYVPNNGHGHITTINLATGAHHVFNLSCANQPDTFSPTNCSAGANPWGRAQGMYVPSLNRVFFSTGTNDGCKCFIPGVDYRTSLVALPPDGSSGSGPALDSYTPTDWSAEESGDADLGSANVVALPHGWSSKYPDLGIQGGKNRRLMLVNLANLSGAGGPNHTGGELQALPVPDLNMMRAASALWVDPTDGSVWAFEPGNNGIIGVQITKDASGTPSMNIVWRNVGGYNFTTAVVVANNVLFASDGAGEHTNAAATLQALDPTTGKVLWSSPTGLHHWSSPIVVNGTVYLPDGNSGGFGSGTTGSLKAWRIPGAHGSPPPPTPSSSPSIAPCSGPTDAASGTMGTALGGGQMAETWTPPTTGCVPATAYAIYTYGSNGTSSFMDESTAPTFTRAGLTPGIYYTFTVTCWNGQGWSAWSGWSTWTLAT